MKIYVLAALHGNELFGLKVLGQLQQATHANIHIRVGHPEAIAKGKRYIQQDLNRSFGVDNGSLEAKLAANIAAEIHHMRPDLVIDMHTSVADVVPIAIVGQLTPPIQQAGTLLGMQKMVVMPPHLIATSMLGCLPQAALSLEYGRRYRSDKLATKTAEAIVALAQQQIPTAYAGTALPTYEVFTTIPKDFAGLAQIQNLEYNTDLNGYPFLAGPDTYQDMGGFLARPVTHSVESAATVVSP